MLRVLHPPHLVDDCQVIIMAVRTTKGSETKAPTNVKIRAGVFENECERPEHVAERCERAQERTDTVQGHVHLKQVHCVHGHHE